MPEAILSDAGSGLDRRSNAGPGIGHLRVIRRGPASVVSRAFATSPLRWLTPRNNGLAAWAFTSTYGGGLVDGDATRLTVEIGPDAMALLSTQASTKVYRSPSGTSSELTVSLAPGGLLVSAPDPVVCFAHARFRQVQEFHMAADADLVAVDGFSSGRRARGERWAFDAYATCLRVYAAGHLVCHEAVTLRADDAILVDRFGRFDALATVVILGPRLRATAQRLLAQHAAVPEARHANTLWVASPVGDGGCLVRIAGVSLEAVGQAIRRSLDAVPALLGDDPWARKW